MIEEKIVIPEGWTYFAHRTNSERWTENPFEKKSIILTKLMSVVTESDIYQELSHYGRNHFQGYTLGKGTPFEIRCLIYELPYLRALKDNEEIKNVMLNEFYFDKRNLGGAYGQRHHSIPKGEELVVIGIGNYNEVYSKEATIIWTIPKRFMEVYKNDILKNQYRTINLKSETLEHSKKQ